MNAEGREFLQAWEQGVKPLSAFFVRATRLDATVGVVQGVAASGIDVTRLFELLSNLATAVFQGAIKGYAHKIPPELNALREFLYRWDKLYVLAVPYDQWTDVLTTGVAIARDGLAKGLISGYERHPQYPELQRLLAEALTKLRPSHPELDEPMGS